jgi:hypothetical protein
MNVLFDDFATSRSIGSHESHNAGTHTWLTPPEILAALGNFDLDPCACPLPRPWPTASTMWTREDGSLRRGWFGRVWLNPPFAPKPLVTSFMRRMADHGQGTCLLFARTDTEVFFETVWDQATAILFLKGRPHFHHQSGRRAGANSGAPVCLIAYGDDDAHLLACSGITGRYLRLVHV